LLPISSTSASLQKFVHLILGKPKAGWLGAVDAKLLKALVEIAVRVAALPLPLLIFEMLPKASLDAKMAQTQPIPEILEGKPDVKRKTHADVPFICDLEDAWLFG
jgi:hypothetical protein